MKLLQRIMSTGNSALDYLIELIRTETRCFLGKLLNVVGCAVEREGKGNSISNNIRQIDSGYD